MGPMLRCKKFRAPGLQTAPFWSDSRNILTTVLLLLREMDETAKSQHPTQCTKCDPQQRFFSYRRDGDQFGTQVAFISLREIDDSACSIL